MNDLERLFRLIVGNLSASNPGRLRRPVPLVDIRDSIAPYRANRRALQLESSEDYELALMRLCAGEGGFALTETEEIRKEFADAIKSRNPDLGLLQRHENAALTLNPRVLAETPGSHPHHSYAPPETRAKASSKATTTAQDTCPQTRTRCLHCRDDLPVGRVVNFCPLCGYDQRRVHCSQCHAELEPDWRHCVICGLAIRSPFA